MKEIDELTLPDDLSYAKTHEWAKCEEDIVVIGISDYAQDQLGDVVYVELPEIGSQMAKDQEFGTVESVKAVSEIYLPAAGEIVAVNETLSDNPALVNQEPYGDGWLVKIKPATQGLDGLMSKKEYLTALKP